MMNVANVILFIVDPSEHCGYPIAMQQSLLAEVREMVTVPVIVVSNKSDIVVADAGLTMSTANGTGVEEVLAEILLHKPAPAARTRAVDIRSAIPQEAEETYDGEPEMDVNGNPVKKRKPKRARKPRTKPVSIEGN